MSQSGGDGPQGESSHRAPSPWSPGVRSAPYLPKEAPTWLGPWRLPQVRAQALTALIEDLAGWTRTVHGALATALGVAGSAAVIYADSSLEQGGAATVVTVVGVLAVLGWAVWGLWLTRSGWLVIAATGRWRSAPERGASSGARILSLGVGAFFVSVTIIRIVGAFLLIGLGVWRLLVALEHFGRGAAFMGWFSQLMLAGVLIFGALAVLGGVVGMVLALRRRPGESSGSSAGGFAPGQQDPGRGQPPGPLGQEPAAHPGVPNQLFQPPYGQAAQPGHGPSTLQGHGQPAQPGHAQYFQPSYSQHYPPAHPQPVQQGQPGPSDQPGAPAYAQPAGYQQPPQAQPMPQEIEDLEQTRFAARLGPVPADSRTRAPVRHRVTVLLEDGRHLPDEATTLLGRAPQAKADEQVEALLDLADPAVSKTHLEVRVRGGTVVAVDRASTNGTVLIAADGRESDLEPWQETTVTVGSTLMVGTTRVLVLLPEDAR